jgi:hypothetical protein
MSWPPPWFHNSKFFSVVVISLTIYTQPGGTGTTLLWPIPFYLSGMGALLEVYSPASIILRVAGEPEPRLHDKAG